MTGASSRLPILYNEHKSWAVKLHAYTLDNSCSDLQVQCNKFLPSPGKRNDRESQEILSSLPGIALFCARRVIRPAAPANELANVKSRSTSYATQIEIPWLKPSEAPPSLSLPVAACVPVLADRSNIARSAGRPSSSAPWNRSAGIRRPSPGSRAATPPTTKMF